VLRRRPFTGNTHGSSAPPTSRFQNLVEPFAQLRERALEPRADGLDRDVLALRDVARGEGIEVAHSTTDLQGSLRVTTASATRFCAFTRATSSSVDGSDSPTAVRSRRSRRVRRSCVRTQGFGHANEPRTRVVGIVGGLAASRTSCATSSAACFSPLKQRTREPVSQTLSVGVVDDGVASFVTADHHPAAAETGSAGARRLAASGRARP
jgi:hypothetical protein